MSKVRARNQLFAAIAGLLIHLVVAGCAGGAPNGALPDRVWVPGATGQCEDRRTGRLGDAMRIASLRDHESDKELASVCSDFDEMDMACLGQTLVNGDDDDTGSALRIIAVLGNRARNLLPQFIKAGDRLVQEFAHSTGGQELSSDQSEYELSLWFASLRPMLEVSERDRDVLPIIVTWLKKVTAMEANSAIPDEVLARVRSRMLAALMDLRGGDHEALPFLMEWIAFPYFEDRLNGIDGCGQLGCQDGRIGQTARRALIARLIDEDSKVRVGVERVLGDNQFKIEPEMASGLLMMMISYIGPDAGHVDKWFRDDYFSWGLCLARATDGDLAPLIAEIGGLLDSPNPILRARAVLTFSALGVHSADVRERVRAAKSRESDEDLSRVYEDYLNEEHR